MCHKTKSNQLSSWEDIWKLRFNQGKYKELNIGSKNIKIEYELSNLEIKIVNEEFNLWVGFHDPFKAENHILSIVLRANKLIGLMVRHFISKGGKCFKNI